MKKVSILFVFLMGLALNPAIAQDRAASPASTLNQKVGTTDVTVEYSRPSMKERTIYAADGLVPFGKLWRTGANSATKVTFSEDVKVEGQELAGGSYALLTVPNASEWKVNFYPYESGSWPSYREADPAVSVTVTPQQMDVSVESFTIGITDLRDYSATLYIIWDGTYVPVSLTVK